MKKLNFFKKVSIITAISLLTIPSIYAEELSIETFVKAEKQQFGDVKVDLEEGKIQLKENSADILKTLLEENGKLSKEDILGLVDKIYGNTGELIYPSDDNPTEKLENLIDFDFDAPITVEDIENVVEIKFGLGGDTSNGQTLKIYFTVEPPVDPPDPPVNPPNKTSTPTIYIPIPPPIMTTDDPYIYEKEIINSTSNVTSNSSLNTTNTTTKKAIIIADDVKVDLCDNFNIMDNIKAIDVDGSNITRKITASGFVDTSKAGTYKITYKVVDKLGNTISKQIKVTVENPKIQGPQKCNATPQNCNQGAQKCQVTQGCTQTTQGCTQIQGCTGTSQNSTKAPQKTTQAAQKCTPGVINSPCY